MAVLDVLVPCYLYGGFLKECVDSILADPLRDLRVLILDDASPDSTGVVASELVARDARVSYLRHERNLGHIATYNDGLRWTESKYTLLISADDLIVPGALRRITSFLDDNPHVGFAYGRAAVWRSGEKMPADAATATDDGTVSWDIVTGEQFIEGVARCGAVNLVPTPTVVVRTSVQKRIGEYRPNLPHAGDLEMWLRFACHAPVARTDAVQAITRFHDSNMQHAYYRNNFGRGDLMDRHAAIQEFAASAAQRGLNGQRLYAQLARSLGEAAARAASMAFDAGDKETCRSLADLACAIDGRAMYSVDGIRLRARRLLGLHRWSALRNCKRRLGDLASWERRYGRHAG